MALNVSEAAKKAAEYLAELNPGAERIQLEEIEYVDGPPDKWFVTLSYLMQDKDENPFSFNNRKFKVFTINVYTGEVTSMKIREFK